MTRYRPSRRESRTWHVVSDHIDDRAICNTAVRQEACDAYTLIPPGYKLCAFCRREAFPALPRINQGEVLMALHLDELGCEYVEQYHYVPGRMFRADFAIPSKRILIEINGGIYTGKAHGSASGVIRDNERLRMATLHNWYLVRFTPEEVKCGAAKEWIRAYLAKENTNG